MFPLDSTEKPGTKMAAPWQELRKLLYLEARQYATSMSSSKSVGPVTMDTCPGYLPCNAMLRKVEEEHISPGSAFLPPKCPFTHGMEGRSYISINFPNSTKTDKSRDCKRSMMVRVFNVRTKEGSDGRPVVSLSYIVSGRPARAT